jgi:hypothetical protein
MVKGYRLRVEPKNKEQGIKNKEQGTRNVLDLSAQRFLLLAPFSIKKRLIF